VDHSKSGVKEGVAPEKFVQIPSVAKSSFVLKPHHVNTHYPQASSKNIEDKPPD
jgi:hypothetical protein